MKSPQLGYECANAVTFNIISIHFDLGEDVLKLPFVSILSFLNIRIYKIWGNFINNLNNNGKHLWSYSEKLLLSPRVVWETGISLKKLSWSDITRVISWFRDWIDFSRVQDGWHERDDCKTWQLLEKDEERFWDR